MSRTPSLHRLATIATLTLLAACATGYPGPSGLGVLPPAPPRPLWMGAVRPEPSAPASPLRGAAAVTTTLTPGYSHVLVSITGGTPGHSYDWTLHRGNCTSVADAVPVNGYPLVTYADGTAKAEGYVAQRLSSATPYSVVIAGNGGATPACADLAYGGM